MKNKKILKERYLNKNNKKEGEMAYYCLKCRCWHYAGSAIHMRHRRYASKRPPRRRLIRKSSLRKFFRS